MTEEIHIDYRMIKWTHLSESTRNAIFSKSGGRCWYCGAALTHAGRKMTYASSPLPNTFVVDHIIPKTKGGDDDLQNLVPCCWFCNQIKKSHTVEEFRVIKTRLENNVPRFTDEQLSYLQRIGCALPAYPPYVFFFEKKGWTP